MTDLGQPLIDHGLPMTDPVHCRADHAYPGRPLEVFWEGEWLLVSRVVDELLTPEGKTYRVVCEGERSLLLTYDLVRCHWAVSMVELP